MLQHIVDDSLSRDVAVTGLDASMDRRFLSLAEYATRECGAEGVLFTCSAFGSCIEKVEATFRDRRGTSNRPITPVLKPNEAMMAEAVAIGGRAAVLSVFEPTVESIVRELGDLAAAESTTVDVEARFVPDALEILRGGDELAYNEAVADAAEELVRTEGPFDSVVLAMFSMACSGPTVAARLAGTSSHNDDAPSPSVLTSPLSAVHLMRRRLAIQDEFDEVEKEARMPHG